MADARKRVAARSPKANTHRRIEEKVSRHPFFKGLPSSHIKRFAACASEATYEAGRILFREGDQATHFYAILDGTVSVELMDPGSSGVPIQCVGKGEVLGWSWLVPPHQKRFDAKALDLVQALVFDAPRLRKEITRHPALGNALLLRLIQVIGSRLQATRLQLLEVYNIPR